MRDSKRARIARSLYLDELRDHEIYNRFARTTKQKELRLLLEKITRMEKRHMEIWADIAGGEGALPKKANGVTRLKFYLYLIARKLFGIAFILMLLGRNEMIALNKYKEVMTSEGLSEKEKRGLATIIKDEKASEAEIRERTKDYKGHLDYIGSIVLGLNDGLVEVLAAVAGIAVVATSSFVVVIAGVIIGVAGTMSMAGGVYLSSKSENLVEESDSDGKTEGRGRPIKEALYTGACYFFGALLSVIPFALGLNGFAGIIAAVILVSITLTVASFVIAVVSGTRVRHRVAEMLAISLGAVIVTVILGSIARIYFGVAI